MKTDIQIAQEAEIKRIEEIAEKVGLKDENLSHYGRYKAKVDHRLLKENENKENAKVVLVTAITPTPAGEGKTTMTVGLGDALQKLNKSTMICLREPSLGPVFGIKGGAAGGGYSQVIPMEDINLHFTGDLHAIGAANNLLAAMLDNHIFQGNPLNIDPRRITWKRALDMNDRQLRYMVNGLEGRTNGTPREDGFDITVASEIMAVFCLATDLDDLKERLSRIVVAYTYDNEPITTGDLKAEGALTALLKDAFDPNLVQTLEHTPAFIHGGPFANIAHGCNSVIATKLAMKLADDFVITEAGFGADLGAEKFLDIKCRQAGIDPSAVVIVATIRALKHHGGAKKEDYDKEDLEALKKGFVNLEKHVENIKDAFGLPCVIAINRFPKDTENEIALLKEECEKLGVEVSLAEGFSKGGEGVVDLAEKVIKLTEKENNFKFSYELDNKITDKINSIATKVYGADGVEYAPAAKRMIEQIEEMGYGNLPICIAKTQYSLSDDAKLLARPENFNIEIREVRLSAGAGFIVVISGAIMTMPGLPRVPAAESIDVDESGLITGLF